MNYMQRVGYWGELHHPKWLDIVRIAFGLFLLIKGVEFANNMSATMNLMSAQTPFNDLLIIVLYHYVVFAHLLGGLLIACGLLTRFACLIQIPILLGAILFINSNNGMWKHFSELFLSILVLLLLIFFMVAGNGPWSLDRAIDRDQVK